MKALDFCKGKFSLRLTSLAWAPWVSVLLLAGGATAVADREHSALQRTVPATLRVPEGNKVAFTAEGVGVQIYSWSAASSSWVFQAPAATLFGHEREHVVGIHYAGPTWQATDGSKVVATREAGETVNPQAIPWLRLKTSSTTGPGIFADVTYIQRLVTRGGLAPSTPGTLDGQQALVPYSALYVFYVHE